MKKQATPLAKISRPYTSGAIIRKRLTSLLDAGKKQPVTWISGPAGSGKTTLIASYIEERGLPCLWYQIDELDADPATFFYYLGLAAKQAAPRNRKPLPLLTPEYLPGIATFTQRFFEKLYAGLKPPFAVVLDNYQEAPDQAPLHDLLSAGLSLPPQGIRVFVLSRNEPLPAFMRPRANNGLNVVGRDELRFTLEEAKQMLRQKGKQKPDEDVLNDLHATAEGWAAGLVLLMEGAGTKKPGSQSSDRHVQPQVFSYFAGEVFDKLDSATRDFLLMTSFLPTMTARMAEKMTDQEGAGRILSSLNRNNFFTEKHQTKEPSYQYHALFREFLLARMKESLSSEGLPRVQNRAAAILEEAGRTEDAASIYRETQNWERYIPLILGQAQALISQGRSATLSEWLAAVPKQIGVTIPWLQYWTGACTLLMNPVDSQPCFKHAFELFKKGDDATGQFLAWSGIADSIIFAGFDYALLDPWLEALDELLKRHPDFPSQELEALVSNSVFGALLYRRTSRAMLAVWEERAARLLPSIADDRLRVMLGAHLLNYYLWFGDLAKASQLIDTLRSNGLSRGAHPLALLLFHNIEAAYYGGATTDFERCHETVAQALKTAETVGVHLLDEFLISQGVYGALSAGEVSRGAGLLGQIQPRPGLTRRFDTAHFHYLAGWEAALSGDLPRALEHTQSSLSLSESAGVPFPQALNHMALAQVFCLLENYAAASQHIVSVRRINDEVKSEYMAFVCGLQEAWLALKQDDETKRLVSLRAAFAIGKKRGLVNFPWWLPRVMSRLCATALEAGIEVDYVKELISKRGLLPPEITTEANPQLENWPWPLKIFTLGRFELIADGKPMQFTGKVQQKPLALLKALIAFGGRDVAEERLTDLLWPEADGDLAHKSFEMTVQRLRRLINIDKVVQLQERRLSLAKGLCWVDVRELEGLIEKTDAAWQNGHPSGEASPEAVLLSEKALALYKGHFLPADSGQAWLLSFRERLRSKFLRLVSRLGLHHERALRWERAAEVYRKGLEVDDHAEEFYQRLMICYERLGREAEAVVVYQRCREVLLASLGMPPSRITEDLYQSISEQKR
jgi:DNA-binding SARP family transcriptional activator